MSRQITRRLIMLAAFLAAFLLSACDNPSQSSKPVKELYSVVKVVDGDTIDVDINGKTERLRLVGMDTPETSDPRKVVQCFAKEASEKAKEIKEKE